MKNSIFKFFPILLIFFISGCEIQDEMTDDELIDAIINSEEKVQVIESDLPTDAINTMKSNMPDDFFDDGSLAPKLGYEIKMRTLDFFFMGDKSDDIYFDINGRELQRSNGDDKKKRGDKDSKGDDKKSKKKNCFYLEYPVSIKFSDNSVVEVADKKEHCEALKTWHKANPTVKERAQFVFPINIYWVEKDSKTVYTISNHDEMRELHGKCKGSKESDKKN
tara:strand:- start:10 stop:672 length:663 start_codon:yes stop_codon:yes gene_type:complete